jgi:integrase
MSRGNGMSRHTVAVAAIQRVREESRERFLTLEEMKRLQTALATSRKKRSAQAVMLLIATGARRGEVLGATWSALNDSQSHLES